MKVIGWLAICVLMGLPAGNGQSVALGQESGGVKLDVVPASIEMPLRGESQVQVVLQNPTNKPLEKIALSWFTGTGVEVTIKDNQNLESLAQAGEAAWVATLKAGKEGLVQGAIHFRAVYRLPDSTGAAHFAFANLEVKARESDSVDKVAELTTKTSSAALNEQRPGFVYLVLVNKSNQELRIGKITYDGPEFLSAESERKDFEVVRRNNSNNAQQEHRGNQPFTLGPRDSLAVPIKILTTNVVRPGKHRLLFEAPIDWGKKDNPQKTTLMATEEFEVGILGESEILTALGLPSFLILPGFLMILTFRYFARRGKGGTEPEDSLLKNATNPTLWILAITLSGITAFLYPHYTRIVLRSPRDYLIGYGMSDVVHVWLGAIFLGAFAWLSLAGLRRLILLVFTPSQGDDPIRLLRKLSWQRLGILLYQIEVKINGQNRMAFLLQPRREEQEKFWVGPFIELRWDENVSPTAILRQQIESERKANGNPRRLAKLLEEGREGKLLEVRWFASDGFTGPQLVNKTDVVSDHRQENLIVIEA
jgi:hypothetical protein